MQARPAVWLWSMTCFPFSSAGLHLRLLQLKHNASDMRPGCSADSAMAVASLPSEAVCAGARDRPLPYRSGLLRCFIRASAPCNLCTVCGNTQSCKTFPTKNFIFAKQTFESKCGFFACRKDTGSRFAWLTTWHHGTFSLASSTGTRTGASQEHVCLIHVRWCQK